MILRRLASKEAILWRSASVCRAACVLMSVCPPIRDCTRVALVSAAKVMRCTQCSLVVVCACLGESCYINVDTGNSSYTDPSTLAADGALDSHGNVVCSITLTNPVHHYNHRLLNTESVASRDNDDDDDDDGGTEQLHSQMIGNVALQSLQS